MFLIIPLLIFITICAIINFYFKWKFTYWKKRGLETGSPTIPFGTLGEITAKVSGGVILQKHYNLFKSKGLKHAGVYIVTSPFYMPIDLKIIKSILSVDFSYFSDKYYYLHEPVSFHLFSMSGEKWRSLRQKLTPTFTSGKMKMMFDMIINCSKPISGLLNDCEVNHSPIDIKDAIAKFTTDVIGSCAFGLQCNSFEDPNAEFRIMGTNIFKETTFRSFKNMFALCFQSLAHKLDVYALTPELNQFYSRIVTETVKYREENGIKRKDFMQLLINLKNTGTVDGDGFDEKGKISLNDMIGQSFVFFAAGFETSSTAVTFCMHELSQNHVIQNRLRNEIRSVLKKYDDKITYDALTEMTYLQQVIDETLRKYPTLPILDRKCIKDFTIPEVDFTIKAGTPIVIPVLGLHRDPEFFPNPDKFDPERFSKENIKNMVPFSYFPFGEGPRLCIGKRFGLMQVKIAIINLLKDYEYTLNDKTSKNLDIAVAFVLQPRGKVLLNVTRVH